MDNNTSTNNNLFTNDCVSSSRVIHTASAFARSSLLYLQETGHLTALKPHVSGRDHLSSYLFFVVLDGAGWLEYKGERYELSKGSAVFIDCKHGYSQSSSETLWTISWAHFNSSNMPAIWNKWIERGGKCVFHPEDHPDGTSGASVYIKLLEELYTTASSESYIRDVEINTVLTELIGQLFQETVYEEGHNPTVGMNTGSTANTTTAAIDIAAIKSYIDTHYGSLGNAGDISRK